MPYKGADRPYSVRVPLQHAVLALLAEGPSYGYELKANFEKAVGPQWGGLNIGHVYQILDRLHRDGMVSSHTVPQESRPDRTVYLITSAGRSDLDQWLAKPTARASGYRDDFLLKVLAAAHRGPEAIRALCRVEQEARQSELQLLRASRRGQQPGTLATLTVEAAILHTQADLKLVESVEARAGEFDTTTAPGDAAQPAS